MQSIEHKNANLLWNVSSSVYWVDIGVSVWKPEMLSVDTNCGGENVQTGAEKICPN